MMYSEFVAGTGCKENDHNYEVFKHLEILYMNSNVSKAEIYEMGKKLVDNSKSEKEIRVEKEIKEEMERVKEQIEYYKEEISYREAMKPLWKMDGDKEMLKNETRMIKYCKEQIKELRIKMNGLKWVLA